MYIAILEAGYWILLSGGYSTAVPLCGFQIGMVDHCSNTTKAHTTILAHFALENGTAPWPLLYPSLILVPLLVVMWALTFGLFFSSRSSPHNRPSCSYRLHGGNLKTESHFFLLVSVTYTNWYFLVSTRDIGGISSTDNDALSWVFSREMCGKWFTAKLWYHIVHGCSAYSSIWHNIFWWMLPALVPETLKSTRLSW